MAMGKRKRDRQQPLFVATTNLAAPASHPFYQKLNQLLAEAGSTSGSRPAASSSTNRSRNAASPAKTEMLVAEMCGGCVKKITARLKQIPEIATIQCDVNTSTVTVVPQADKSISPRVLWDAMAQIGRRPRSSLARPGHSPHSQSRSAHRTRY